MSAVAQRERRATAGRRMSNLVGKAAEEDETFWSHDVWDEDDSGNDSFRESDEDSEHRVDKFDSDFDDSEEDNEAEELAAGEAAEAELRSQERSTRKKGYVDIAKAGRDLLQKKKGTSRMRKKDLMGEGFNAGLVLNFPSGPAPPTRQTQSATPVTPMVTNKKFKPRSPAKPVATLASTRSLRSAQALARRQVRAATRKKTQQKAETKSRSTHQPKKPIKRFTQEELLLEAATVTEPENERWLLGRKRIQDLEDALNRDGATQRQVRGKILMKFHSRRGCYNTLTFPEMDAVPEILARKHEKPMKPTKQFCVITGKVARYRDPKTKLGYYDSSAFKELRRRLQAGEKLDQRSKKAQKEQMKKSTVAVAINETETPDADMKEVQSRKEEQEKNASSAVATNPSKTRQSEQAELVAQQAESGLKQPMSSPITASGSCTKAVKVDKSKESKPVGKQDKPPACTVATSSSSKEGKSVPGKPTEKPGKNALKQPAKIVKNKSLSIPKTTTDNTKQKLPAKRKASESTCTPNAAQKKTEKSRKVARRAVSPVTANIIQDALAAYNKLHPK